MHSHGQLLVCGCSTTTILFAVGVSCLVVAAVQYADAGSWDAAVDCGFRGKPPLLEWVLGTGIAYLILCWAYAMVSKKGPRAGSCVQWIVMVSNTFLFAWMIVGAVSLWRDGTDCEQINLTLWRMGYSAVIISIVVVCCGGYTTYESMTIVPEGGTGDNHFGGDIENQ
jgi:hypothetical protein